MKQLFWGILFLCFTFSCSDEGGTLEDPSDADRNFTVFTEIFEKFLEAEASDNFTDGTSGLTFIGEQPCDFPPPTLFFDGQTYPFNTTYCYHYTYPEPDQYESFSVVNAKLLTDGVTVYAIAAFLNLGIPETGTYETNPICDLSCSSNVSVRVYFVNDQGEFINYFFSYPTLVKVINNDGKVTVSFDTEFYSAFYPVNAHGSGTVSCCN